MASFEQLKESLFRLGFNDQQLAHLTEPSYLYGRMPPLLLYTSRPGMGLMRCRFEFSPTDKKGRTLTAYLGLLNQGGKWVEIFGRIFPENLSLQEVMSKLRITFPAIIELGKPACRNTVTARIARHHRCRRM
ncbi:hypothetical protein HF324_27760 [Chitinophaga oryzae]|uniref:Uncharacterized protein n=1 Tax=Chitinophaga oryzae TaxID=2725414 RepID=A0AAE7DA44_9BACT|nr:hypothetical protein [Chitinophaga oryzae]QJB34922.1 hypothetical protein HF329_27900 [Chitinophaga oryzae]QJB41433.1 hypothetical protein HF324_27760 [Chitinophaga oryzae]